MTEHVFAIVEQVFQLSLDDLGTPLVEATFVVVDLETTGGAPNRDRITEVGAVKTRGGEVLGELAVLVDPETSIPGSITALTGISADTVAGRPPIAAVLPSFLEFCRGTVLVAHNARFDTAFLNHALTALDYPPLEHPVVCTAQLARRLIGDEVTDRRLGTLARHFRSDTVPVHRALADARATVDVFHGLVGAAGTHGVVTVEDLIAFSRVRNMPLFTSRRQMADHLPRAPGVYRFVSAAGEVLYVGKATDLRARVRQYFGTDRRRRIRELVAATARIDHTVTPTAVEAEILEAREIRAHRPRFNRALTRTRAPVWLTLSTDSFPRLVVARRPPRDGRPALGPLPGRRVADRLAEVIADAVPLRRCTTTMRPDTRFEACMLAEIGRCPAPCIGRTDVPTYRPVAAAAAEVLDGYLDPVIRTLERRMAAHAADGRYREAARTRDALHLLATWVARTRRHAALRDALVLAASRPARQGGREVVVQRAGWLAGSAVVASSEGVGEVVRRLTVVDQPVGPPPPEELAILQRWMLLDGVRLEHVEGTYAWPIRGSQVATQIQQQVTAARRRTGRPELHLAAKRLQQRPR